MKAVYAFSGDPITFGHIDIIKRSLKVFDSVIVAVGSNPDKKYTFGLSERVDMAKKALQRFGDSVEVMGFNGMLIDFVKENCLTHIIRGIRSNGDFEYEKTLADINKTQGLGIETWFLPCNPSLGVVSSSASKELVKHLGDVSSYVPMHVKYKLEERVLDAKIIGITGEIGAGKSFVAKCMHSDYYSLIGGVGHYFHNIELDEIGRDILAKYTKPIYHETRRRLVDAFGESILMNETDENVFIDKNVIAKIIFSDKECLEMYNEITRDVIMFKLREEIKKCVSAKPHSSSKDDPIKNVILVNSALLVEGKMLDVVNNNVIFVDATTETRITRLKNRGYSDEESKNRMRAQLSTKAKHYLYTQSVIPQGYGNHIFIHNNETITATNRFGMDAPDIYEQVTDFIKNGDF